MAEIFAQTERLLLRSEEAGDLAAWLEHINTPTVMEKNGGVQTAAKVAESFAKAADAVAAGGLPFAFVALKSSATLIGKCGLARIETPTAPEAVAGQVEIGWSLRADCWGQGYATEAATAMLAIAFERFELPFVYSQTSERNRGSWRVMQKLGMIRLQSLDYHDPAFPPDDNPTMVWGINREAWFADRAEAAADA